MTFSKRLFDLGLALALVPFVVPMICMVSLAVLILDGRPVFYISERMTTPTKGFWLLKFRTMRVDATDWGATGPNKTARITKVGAILRRYRLDELPQLWNVWRGHMSFVGPRPPLRVYVEDYPEIYGKVLKSRPGLTGLATITYNRHETLLLSKSRSAEETEAIYRRACVPRKARIDLIYQRHQSLGLDIWILFRTFVRKKRV